MAPYVSEELIAEALAPYPAGLVIGTKGGWERVGPGQWIHNASPKHLQAAVEGSLKRLRLQRIDLFQLHIPDPAVSFDASMETLARLREQGKIRHLGLSNVTLEHVERARKIVPIVSVQNRYSFADREWDFLLNHCEQKGIAFIPWAPLGQNRQGNEILEKAAKELGWTPLQVALAWLLRRSSVMLPIPGTSSSAHAEENIRAAGLKLARCMVQRIVRGEFAAGKPALRQIRDRALAYPIRRASCLPGQNLMQGFALGVDIFHGSLHLG